MGNLTMASIVKTYLASRGLIIWLMDKASMSMGKRVAGQRNPLRVALARPIPDHSTLSSERTQKCG